MGERLFELLFKYRPVVFEQGALALGASWPMVAAAIAGAVVAAAVIVAYARIAGGGRLAVGLAALRVGALALLVVALLRPVLIVRTVEPRRNFLGILLDDSRSMQIADDGSVARGAEVQRAFAPDGPLVKALGERFTVRFFRFSSAASRVAGPAALTFAGTRTELAPSLAGARDELAGVPLSGLIVATDGADTAETGLTGTLRALKAASVPVFTVGFGRERFGKDVQLGRVQAPARVLKDASLSIDVVVSQYGYAGETVPVQIEDDGRIVGTEDVPLPADGEPATVRVPWTASEAGPRVLRFRIPPRPGEMVTENNVRDVLVDVEDRAERIIYIEGAPRYEMKFVRHAVADDKNLHLVVLQRTAENKFLRLGVENAQELVEGFPKTRDELFAYRGVILGSIPASFFTPDQLRMLADFVGVRGGGLLALGGRHAFAEGGYLDTPVADALPVVLEPDPESPFFAEVKVHPTRAGEAHPATQIGATELASAERWASLPPLTSVNQLRRAKPGATVLLTGDTDAGRDAQVVLAWQRFGAGKALALGVQDTWLWQMHHDIGVDDLTHELLWRRLLRWLVDGVPDRVMATASRSRVEPGEALTVGAEVRDKTYLDVNDSQVTATFVDPAGRETTEPMAWAVDRDGQYQARFTPDAPGLYEVKIAARRGGETLGEDRAYFRAAPSDAEYFDAGMRAPLLRRVAEETGGRFYTAADVDGLAKDVQYAGGGVTVVDQRDLWDMPVLLLLFLGLVGGEWAWRRRRGWA